MLSADWALVSPNAHARSTWAAIDTLGLSDEVWMLLPAMTGSGHVGARRAFVDVAVQIIGRVGNLVLGVVVTLAMIRALGADKFGEWSTILAVTQIATNVGELGIEQVAISRAASDPSRAREWLGALVSLRLLLALPIMFCSVIAVLLIAPTPQSRLAGVLISCVLLMGGPASLGVVFQLRVRNDISIALMTVNSIVWTMGVLLIAALSGSILAFAIAFLGASALRTLLTAVIALRISEIRMRGANKLWGQLARVGIGVGLAGVLVTFYVKLDQILVLEFAGSRQAGLYGAVYRILDQIQFIPAAVMTTLFPLIASAYPKNLTRVRDLLQIAGEYLAVGALPVLAFTIVAANPIVSTLFGRQFAAAAPALPVLMGAFVFISLAYVADSMVVVLELQRRFLTYAAIALVVNVALNLILIPRYGFRAAAWVTLLTEALATWLSLRTVMQVLEMRIQAARLLRAVTAATLMGAATWLASDAQAPLAVLVGVAMASYLLAVAGLRVLTVSEVRTFVGKEPSGPTEVFGNWNDWTLPLGRPTSHMPPLPNEPRT